MSSFKKRRYEVHTWHGQVVRMTAKQLCERVMEDSKSDYNWIASAPELIRVCKKRGFPKVHSQRIKCAILNCYADITNREISADRYRRTSEVYGAIYYCYNSLPNSDKHSIEVKKKYLIAVLKTIAHDAFDLFSPHCHHYGKTYRSIRDKWIRENVNKYLKCPINFSRLTEKLHEDFVKTIMDAETQGAFEEDDKKGEQESKVLACLIAKLSR